MKNQKSILILFEPTNQTPLLESLLLNMREKGIIIDAWDASIWQYIEKKYNNDIIYFILSVLKLFFQIPKIGIFIRRVFSYFVMRNMVLEYAAVDIHFFTPTYFRLLDYLIKKQKPYKITIWGSDFFRLNQQQKEKQKKYYLNAKIIQCATKEIQTSFLKDFPSIAEKMRIARFGNFHFDIIEQCKNEQCCSLLPVNIVKDKIVITCGYNGSKAQQHEFIIRAVDKLPEKQKDKIVLFFPMTYGSISKYKNMIQSLLIHSGVSHYIFTKHLSNEENAQLRILTDIAVNIQITDALSGSLQEHLYAESLLLVGNWLPYRIFEEIGVFYIKTSQDELSMKLSYCIDNLKKLKEKAKGNSIKIKNLSSWEVVSPIWTNIYNELCI
jgi:hypothetical protein